MELKELIGASGGVSGLAAFGLWLKSKLSKVQYKDTCEATHKGVDKQLKGIECDIKETKTDVREIRNDIKQILLNSTRRRDGDR